MLKKPKLFRMELIFSHWKSLRIPVNEKPIYKDSHSLICHSSTNLFLSLGQSWLLMAGILSIFLFSCPTALAIDFTRTIKPYTSYGVIDGDNMLRIRNRLGSQNINNVQISDLIAQGRPADISQRFRGRVMFEKEISQQRFSTDLDWPYNKFERSPDLKNLRGSWNELIGNRLDDSKRAVQRPLKSLIFQHGIKALRPEQTQFINADWRLHPKWSLNGEYIFYDLNTESSLQRMRFLNRTENRFEGGIDYSTSDRNTVGVFFRNIIGNFPALVPLPESAFTDNGYDQKEVLSKIAWSVSEKSRFLWTGGWVEPENKSSPERDFSGFNARVAYNWRPIDKIGLMINGWRQTAPPPNLTATFSLNTGVSIIPSWNITHKIRLEGELSYETRKLNSFGISTDPSLMAGRNNAFRNTTLRLTYNPYLGLQLSTAIHHHPDINTDSLLGGFSANGVNANLQYVYGQR